MKPFRCFRFSRTPQWDSYHQATDGAAPSYAGQAINAPTHRSAVWFSTPPNAGAGVHRLARLTVIVPAPALGMLRVQGASLSVQGGGTLIPFDLSLRIPEPASAALGCAGAALAFSIRRTQRETAARGDSFAPAANR
ncbi:MAG: hypothetical protein U1D55_19800 [Phycisphaerae bacterium]